MSIEIRLEGAWDQWVRGFGRFDNEVADELMREWNLAADVMFDRSQQFVHVLTGELKGSGLPPRMSREGRAVVAELEYAADHAIYEERRGGEHAFLSRAYEATTEVFERALSETFEGIVRRWR